MPDENIVSAEVPILSPRTEEEFRQSLESMSVIGMTVAVVPDDRPAPIEWPDEPIVPGTKSADELAAWLQETYDVEETSFDEFSKTFYWSLRYNAEHALTNEKLRLTPDDFEFRVFRILKTEKNASILDDDSPIGGSDMPYAIIERHTTYISSNLNRLFLELVVQRGVTEDDIANETMKLREYLCDLKWLADGAF